jgi:hypothetical protein
MIDWIKERLVPEAQDWWRLWSARFIGLAIAVDALTLSPVLSMMPDSVRSANPMIFDVVQMVLVSAALVARFVKQPKVQNNVQQRNAAE